MDILRYSALAAKWDTPPKDALDTLVLRCPLWWPDAQNVNLFFFFFFFFNVFS